MNTRIVPIPIVLWQDIKMKRLLTTLSLMLTVLIGSTGCNTVNYFDRSDPWGYESSERRQREFDQQEREKKQRGEERAVRKREASLFRTALSSPLCFFSRSC